MHLNPWFITYISIAYTIRAVMVLVILRRQLAPGASLAWLGIIFLHPYIGVMLYLLIGETRLGRRRAARHREVVSRFRPGGAGGRHGEFPAEVEPMVLQAQRISGLPVVGSSSVEFIGESRELVDRLIADIDAAQREAHLLYYILAPDATGLRVVEALKAAAARGVRCRLLVDALASRIFLRSRVTDQLRDAGVQLAAALPMRPIRRSFSRMDLRNHRKLAIIDHAIAYAGSHNLINPDYGGRAGGPWVDVTGRFTGSMVGQLATVFAEDWAFETGEVLEIADVPPDGSTAMQTVPTGPTAPAESYRRVLLAALQCARSRIILTTPYFVPDEPTMVSLLMAADRGVEVKLLLPLRPDHLFTAAAGRAHFTQLLRAGIAIYLYRPGLLHAKTITIDDAFAVCGSANLDVRSFNLNFELTTLLYGEEVTGSMREIQLAYLADCDLLDAEVWLKRTKWKQYADRAISLFSPLL